MNEPTSRLGRLLRAGRFCVTGEVVPPRSADGTSIAEQARAMVGYVDAVNVTDNPGASAHMSASAGVHFVAEAGIEPTVQVTTRDRNRLAVTSDLLGAWALGARNLLCLSGDPVAIGDHPDATVARDLSVLDVVSLARRLRNEGTTLSGAEIASPPRYLIGVADVPLADPYEPARLEAKVDAGADFVMTQIAYDAERLAAWADAMRPRGLFERAGVIVGLVPLSSGKRARYMDEHLPGVSVPASMIQALEAAGPEATEVGLQLTVEVIDRVRRIPGIAGVHIMGMGHDESVRAVIAGAGLFPRPGGF